MLIPMVCFMMEMMMLILARRSRLVIFQRMVLARPLNQKTHCQLCWAMALLDAKPPLLTRWLLMSPMTQLRPIMLVVVLLLQFLALQSVRSLMFRLGAL